MISVANQLDCRFDYRVEDYLDLQQQGSAAQFVQEQLIDGAGILVIKNFPNDDTLLKSFISDIGQPLEDFRSGDAVFAVTTDKSANNFKCFANTEYHFSLHTDCSDFANVPNGLAMLCVRPAEVGGESLFIQLDKLLMQLTVEDIEFLLTHEWQFRQQRKTILTKTVLVDASLDEQYSICYNRIMLEIYGKLTQAEKQFLDKFDEILYTHALRYKLQENELLICRNDNILHGRTEFNDDAKRLIKRIRFGL